MTYELAEDVKNMLIPIDGMIPIIRQANTNDEESYYADYLKANLDNEKQLAYERLKKRMENLSLNKKIKKNGDFFILERDA